MDPHVLAQRISAETGLKALTWSDFALATIGYHLKRTGIPVNFGITVASSGNPPPDLRSTRLQPGF